MVPHIAPSPSERAITRRRLIRLAGLAGVGATAAALEPTQARLALAQDTSPEAFLADAYARRIAAMNTGDTRMLDGIYDTANPLLASFEAERARFFRGGLGQRWEGTPLLFDSSISVVSLDESPGEVRARIYEWIRVQWVQDVHQIDPIMQANMRKDPGRYVSRLTKGPRGEIVSGMGYPHEVVLTRHASGWRIARDQHDEVDLNGHSPDLVPGSFAAIVTGRPSQGLFTGNGYSQQPPPSKGPGLAMPTSRPLASWSYDRNSAISYAHSFCDPSAGHNYNSTYCSWGCAGVDCANFVSQCFNAGYIPTDGTWNSTYGTCGNGCSPTTAVKGNSTWINNISLRNWVLNSTKGTNFGTASSNINYMGYGDLINYDWSSDGILDHITIVSSPGNESSALICSHTFDKCDYVWHAGYGACGCWVSGYNVTFTFTGMFNGGS